MSKEELIDSILEMYKFRLLRLEKKVVSSIYLNEVFVYNIHKEIDEKDKGVKNDKSTKTNIRRD